MKQIIRGFNGTTSKEVSERELKHTKLAREAATEGFVLLKNDNQILPIMPGQSIALYGAGAKHTIKGGTGSGDVNERASVSIYDGIKNAGYVISNERWLLAYDDIYNKARLVWKEAILKKAEEINNFFEAYSTTPFMLPCGDELDEEEALNDGANIAIFVLSRVAGENADRHDTKGDFLMTDEEEALLSQVSRCYSKVVVVINTGGLVDLNNIEKYENVFVIVQFMQAGQEGGNAFADILSGKVSPSGKMTDTWALSYNDYPNAATFSHKSGDVFAEHYYEGIYVGYRYFDTFDVPVRYSFGHGLSYTEFDIKFKEALVITETDAMPRVSLTVEVANIGEKYAGKEVVQIYVSCPQKKLIKEFRRLVAFAKTDLLSPEQKQTLQISFPIDSLASYDESQAAWIMEGGCYGIWIGNSLANANLCSALELDGEAVVMQCEHICPLQQELTELTPAREKVQVKEQEWIAKIAEEALPDISISAKSIPVKVAKYTTEIAPMEGKAAEIVNALSKEQLIQLTTGEIVTGGAETFGASGTTAPGSAAETPKVAEGEPWNLSSIVLADGPAGLRLIQHYEVYENKVQQFYIMDALEGGFFAKKNPIKGELYYQYCTAIPVGTLLAQTWNTELITEIGQMIGKEMEEFFVTLWLAPGMNIHRNPLCGRNFEYYSEDPLLSGMMAAAMTKGVQRQPGCGTTIKHFACNNQEDNRLGSDSIVSERALREIYLKGFEIAIKSSQPMSVMTSYNLINGVHTANSYDLCTKVAREEWGFRGAIMTDWTTTTNSTAGVCTASGCMHAQNDMIMPGFLEDHEDIQKALDNGSLNIDEVKRCVYNTVRLILQSNRYENAVSYTEQFDELKSYIDVIVQ